MKINKNNYESYFVDYLEGNLNEKLVDDFIEFLQQNPELKEELSLFDSVSVVPEKIEFAQKKKLYKEKYDAENAFNQAAIERLEGEISEKEKKNFEKYLSKRPEKKKEEVLFRYTKLQPDESLVFNKKQKLYHYSAGKTVLLWSARIAAVLALAFMVYLLTDQKANNLIPDSQVASLEKNNTKKDADPVTKETKNIETPVEQDKTKEKEQKVKKEIKTTDPVVKKPAPKAKETKSLRETTKGRMGGEDLALHRIPLEVPSEMSRITASVKTTISDVPLATMKLNSIETPAYEERLLADVVKEKTGIDKLSLNKIKKAGLNLVSNITKDNLSYETNKNGKITEINYDSRLLAFSIPTHDEDAGE
ncbi:hypothetical protein [Maribellus maritimus]|uniref:hypothetical protein n=1 Tax=Maribellus maritimus TaxID=2870838 RepID=UPI001EEB89BE|nr:hypothetical protein [Maribellus maritimus]MCG6190724.1 hypothetical protein [Maribellus maritimus]